MDNPTDGQTATPGRKRAITKTYFRRFALISCLFLLLLGTAWLALSHWRHMRDAELTRRGYLQSKGAELRVRTKEATAYIDFMRTRITVRLKNDIRRHVEEAHAVALALYEETGGGPQAVARIKTALRAVRFDKGRGYLFAVGLDGTAHMVAERPDMEGQNILNFQDSLGRHMVQQAIGIARKQGEGFFEYTFTKPGAEGDGYRKISFVKRLDPLDWYIGAGLYVDDVADLIRHEVLDWLNSRDYGTKGYLFAGTYEGIALLGPARGKNMWEVTDASGIKIVQELVAAAKDGGGFVTYQMPPLDEGPTYPKLSYAEGVADWGWYVGCGADTKDLEMEIGRMEKAARDLLWNISLGILGAMALLLAAMALAMRATGRRLDEDFQSFRAFFDRAAAKAEPIDRAPLHLEEFDRLAEAANRMIAERGAMEDALRESESRYRGIFENIVDGYYRADMDGRLLFASPSAFRMLGYETTDEVRGLDLGRAFHVDQSRHEAFMRQIREVGRLEGFMVQLKRKDGTHLEVEVNARLVYGKDGGAPVAMEGTFRDVTERKRTQELLVQTEKMMSVGGLAAGMAHEINNPLGGILQGVQNILRRLSPDLPANREAARGCDCDLEALTCYLRERRILRMLEGIRDSGERAARIVAGMLGFSRASESRRAPCDLNELADKTIELASSDYDLSRKYDFRKIEIVREYDPDLGLVSCTATEIEQVLLNLLRNAAQAMADKGTSGGGPRIVVRTRREEGFAVIQAEDNGPGMDEDTRRRAFDPFFTTKPPGRGTGLGLSVAYFIVTQNHGGEFSVRSAPGKGTTFTVRLPCAG